MTHEKPLSAYRVQLNPGFKIKHLTKILPYLKELGVDTVYTSPYFAIPKGSVNPYQIISPHHFNETLGSEKDFEKFFKALKEHGLQHILDLVPNHLAASVQNRWFEDVLLNGEQSQYAKFFDILFDPYYKPLKGKVLLPILPNTLDACINSNYIKVVGDSLRVGPVTLPLKRGSSDLHTLLEEQNYLLMFWKSAYEVINYRRFFDIIELIGVNMQYPDVYETFHTKVFDLIQRGVIHGLRIDHPDGLYDPAQYLHRLQNDFPHFYVIVEKILQRKELLPSNWNVSGSVGYEYLNLLNGLFIRPENEERMTEVYEQFTGVVHKPLEMLYEIKKTVINTLIQGEINDIVHLITKECTHTFIEVKDALIEVLARFPIYRTYIGPQDIDPTEQDRSNLVTAFSDLNGSVYDTLRLMFCLESNPNLIMRVPLMRLQQLMPCVMAKSLEDTFLYRYNRLLSLNEVGGSPLTFGTTPKEFHQENIARLEHHPYNFLASSTHDTKRSEDIRYRISILSEVPDRFQKMIAKWARHNAPVNPGLDRNIEYFIYQMLIGFWPGSHVRKKRKHLDRFHAYIKKAMREAKDYTEWVNPNFGYEHNVFSFVEAICTDKEFTRDLDHFVDDIIPLAAQTTLSAIAIKGCSPGVFDLYQGTEFFDDSLVDPDNRREVDYGKRIAALKKLGKLEDGPITDHHKMALIHAMLRLRREHPDLIMKGRYIPIAPPDDTTIAFAREHNGTYLVVAVRRFFTSKHEPLDLNLPFEVTLVDYLTKHPVLAPLTKNINILISVA